MFISMIPILRKRGYQKEKRIFSPKSHLIFGRDIHCPSYFWHKSPVLSIKHHCLSHYGGPKVTCQFLPFWNFRRTSLVFLAAHLSNSPPSPNIILHYACIGTLISLVFFLRITGSSCFHLSKLSHLGARPQLPFIIKKLNTCNALPNNGGEFASLPHFSYVLSIYEILQILLFDFVDLRF